VAGAEALEALLGVRPAADWPGPNFSAYLPLLLANPARGRWNWLVIHPEDRLIVGDSGFHGPPDTAGVVELGYIFAAAYRGRGYATESARALLDWACVQPEVHGVVANCAPDNQQSIRVLEKLGLRCAGIVNGELHWTLDCKRGAAAPMSDAGSMLISSRCKLPASSGSPVHFSGPWSPAGSGDEWPQAT